jgi:hypothetical protein
MGNAKRSVCIRLQEGLPDRMIELGISRQRGSGGGAR